MARKAPLLLLVYFCLPGPLNFARVAPEALIAEQWRQEAKEQWAARQSLGHTDLQRVSADLLLKNHTRTYI